MAAAVELTGVGKRFGACVAVADLSLEVPVGAICGLIGPNGSGKTTSLRMIMGIIEPDHGQVRLFAGGVPRGRHPAIAYLPEERGLYRKMPVGRQLTYLGVLKGMRWAAARREARDWLRRLGLGEWEGQRLEALSKGMSQKVQIIAALLGGPRLLILDEPFSGLDPVNLESVRAAILELRGRGATILFSTHDMHAAETFCDRICMIYRGRKVLDGTLAEIQAGYGADTVRLGWEGAPGWRPDELPGVTFARDLGRFWELRCAGASDALLQQLPRAARLTRFEVVHPGLHDIFVRIARPDPAEMNGGGEADA